MKNERILSYNMSQKIADEDLNNISAAGSTTFMTANGSYSQAGGWDSGVDVTWDL